MTITRSLLYLLLLYAVLDKDNKLSLTTGLTIAFVIMLLNCYLGRLSNNRCCSNSTSASNDFLNLNGIF